MDAGRQETGEILLNGTQKPPQGIARDVDVWFVRFGDGP